LVVAVFCILALFTIGAKAQDYTFNSASLEKEVTMDGSIGADEWTDASKNEMEPFYGIGQDYGNSYLYIKNDEEYLYFLCDQAGAVTDWVGWALGFDADNNDDWTPGVDACLFIAYNETAETPWALVFQLANETYPLWDIVEDNGILYNGSFGTSGDIANTHPILEIKIPLDLVCVNGSEGGTVGFFFAYLAGGDPAARIYCNVWPLPYAWVEDLPVEESIAKWGDLVIGAEVGPPPPPPTQGLPGWVLPTVAVVVIVIVIAAVYMLRR